MLFNTNAETANVRITDPNFLEFGYDQDRFGGLESGATTEAIDKIVAASVNVVDVFIYDTRKDNDQGAWRADATTQSWYTETLNTATRGATAGFPEVVLIVAETDTVTIYDLTIADAPMWRVKDMSAYTVSSVAMMQAQLVAGTGTGLYTFNYLSEVEEVITA